MLWQRCQPQDRSETSVNVTPLIDVSLVLVVILLLATPLAFESSIGVKSSDKSARQAEQELRNARVEVTILDDEHVRLNKSVVLRSNLMETLPAMLSKTTERTVVIACAKGITHGTFVDVLDKAKRSGAAGIAVSGR